MSALAEALGQAQGKALAALQKAYVAGALDAEELIERCDLIGCTDVVDQATLLKCLAILKEHGQTEPSYTERRKDSSPTPAQVTLIDRLANEGGFEKPDLTGGDAGAGIADDRRIEEGHLRPVRVQHPVLMCACEPGYLCSKCEGTPADSGYLLDEPEPPEPFTAEKL